MKLKEAMSIHPWLKVCFKNMFKGCLHPCLEVNFVLNKEAMKHMIFLNRKRLFTDTVSVNKTHLTDTVSVNKKHLTDTRKIG